MTESLGTVEARVLNRLVEHRPEALPAISLVVHDGLSLNGVRAACRSLERRGLVLITSDPSRFNDVRGTNLYAAAPHAVTVPVPGRGRPGVASKSDAARSGVLAALGKLGRPATLREVMTDTRLGETAASKALRALLADGLVTRTQGPAPPVGSVRPWLWEVSRG